MLMFIRTFEVKFRGLQRFQIGLRTRTHNFKIFTFSLGRCVQTVRPRCSVMSLSTPKICTLFSRNFHGSGPYFCFHYTAAPMPIRKKIVTVPWPTFPKILFSSYAKWLFRENVDNVREVPPITGPKCTPRSLQPF